MMEFMDIRMRGHKIPISSRYYSIILKFITHAPTDATATYKTRSFIVLIPFIFILILILFGIYFLRLPASRSDSPETGSTTFE